MRGVVAIGACVALASCATGDAGSPRAADGSSTDAASVATLPATAAPTTPASAGGEPSATTASSDAGRRGGPTTGADSATATTDTTGDVERPTTTTTTAPTATTVAADDGAVAGSSAPPRSDAGEPADGAGDDSSDGSSRDGSGPAPVEFVDDEPSFDIGPPVEIDVELARFPVDDAGVGGPAEGDDGGPRIPPGDAGERADTADPAVAPDDGAPVTGWAGVDRFLESALIRPGNTAASLAVSIDGDIVHTAAFGVRDPATGDPAGSDDRFRIASISKPITAIVAMTLVEDGVVGLDDQIGSVIAEHVGLASPAPGAERLTLRQLLTHRSGYGKYQSTFFRQGATDCADAARTGLSQGGGGGGYVYSNMNYCLAGLLIEALTGLTYEQAVYRQLLTPLGISGMRLPPTTDPGPGEIQHQTTPGRNYMETLGGAGSWIASPTDLVTILDSLDLDTPGFKPLTQDTVFSMVIPAGGTYGQRGYGLGIISYGDGRFGHTGTIESTHAMLLDRGDGVTWAITVAGQYPGESTDLERIMNQAFEAGGFVT